MRAFGYGFALTWALASSAPAGAVDRMVEGFPDLPRDARVVAERYMGCQHFWGELNGRGDERDTWVAAQLKQLKCDQVERDFEQIKAKYHNRPDILRILDEANFRVVPAT
ncbi:MAG: hypothetical protein MUF80_07560 [Burkholderiales bacterium]|nr:hypothetical protein [Burkholderiales bacterium]